MAPELISARAVNTRNVFMESRGRIQPHRKVLRARAALGCELWTESWEIPAQGCASGKRALGADKSQGSVRPQPPVPPVHHQGSNLPALPDPAGTAPTPAGHRAGAAPGPLLSPGLSLQGTGTAQQGGWERSVLPTCLSLGCCSPHSTEPWERKSPFLQGWDSG